MSRITDDGLVSEFIRTKYRPFDAHEEFERGFAAYQAGFFRNPHATESDSARIWDLGVEAAMRCGRANA